MQIKSNDYIRYWHPRKGGWYHGRLVKAGRKWAWVRPLQAASSKMRVPVGSIEKSVL